MAEQFARFMGIDLSTMLGGQRAPPTLFESSFRCYSFAMCGRENLENGDKSEARFLFDEVSKSPGGRPPRLDSPAACFRLGRA